MSSAKSLKMTDTALKFGPEWLRALSYGDSSTSPPPSPGPGAGPSQTVSAPPRYKLAEFRYGREEMLALYDKSVKAPDDMVSLTGLYVEKTQFPLALMQITEEEMRMWQRGVNSDAVLKVMGRGGMGGGPTSGSAPAGTIGGGRGRGGSLERGRGRGGRGGIGGSYMRGTSYDDEGEGGPRREGTAVPFGRGGPRPFERSQSERGWPERGGEREEWNGNNAISPRKEVVGGKGFQDNWRSRERAERDRDAKEGKEEDDGWRTAGKTEKWGRGSSGWRGHENDYETRPGYKDREWDYGRDPEPGARHGTARNWEEDREKGFGYAGRGRRIERKGWDENELPEWAAENPGESGGTFDASGAFRRDTGSDDEENVKKVQSKKEDEKPTETATETFSSDNNNKADAKPRSPPVKALETIAEQEPSKRPAQVEEKLRRSEDDGLDHARAVADTLIAQLVEDEEPRRETKPAVVPAEIPADKWFYRDPQGEVQGPFDSQEMADWFNSGYFTMNLMVRREVDERFTQLGELTKLWGQLPFLVSMGPARQRPPPIKEPAMAEPNSGLVEAEKLQLLQQQLLQQQLFQQQIMSQQLVVRQQIVAKLAQLEGWATLNPAQQEQLIAQQMLSLPLITPSLTDPVLQLQQLRAQMDAHAKAQAELQVRKDPLQSLLTQLQQPGPKPDAPEVHSDPIAQFVQQLGNKGVGMPKPVPVKHEDPIRALLQQLQSSAAPSMPMWPGLEPNGAPGFGLSWPSHHPPGPLEVGLPQTVGFARPSAPLQHHQQQQQQPAEPIPSVWDLNPHVEEQRRLKEHEEMVRREEEEKRRREQEEEEQRRREAEAQAKAQAEAQAQEQARLLEEQRQRKELERLKREEEVKRREEAERKKLEEEERKKKQLEEKRKKDEEKKRLLEEEKKRQEEIRQQLLEEERIRQEEERALEQQRRQQEAIRKLQEEQAARSRASALVQAQANAASAANAAPASSAAPSVAPWTSAPTPSPSAEQPSLGLAEIQKLQEEKEAKEREKERKLAQLVKQQAAAEAAKAKANQPVRWAMHQPVLNHTKSLAEIQAEEAAELSRQKEKERLEREAHQQSLNLAAAGAWGASTHLAWKSSAPSVGATSYPVWGSNGNSSGNTGGFWDEPVPVQKQAPKTLAAVAKSKSVPSSAPAVPAAAVSAAQSTAPNANSLSAKKSRSKKEEDTVKKIFEKKMSNSDSFTQWCVDYLAQLNTSVDGPTFVGFLKDVESPYEVTDYVKSYLGESKEAKDFAKQFLERRSKWKQAKAQAQRRPEDDMCLPAKAVNPTHTALSSEFTEVKGKAKKGKKGKMQKVDPGLLGFSVTSAPDRINVGERDFVDGM